MKIKHILSIAISTVLAAGFVACDHEYIADFTPLIKPSEAPDSTQQSDPDSQVHAYFASEFVATTVYGDESVFYLPIYRPENETDSALTVDLITTDPVGFFNVPESVTFPENSNATEIPVGYDPSAMFPNENYTVDISIANFNAKDYGFGDISVTITYEPQVSEWALLGYEPTAGRNGYGKWTLASPFSGEFENIRVFERHIPSNTAYIEYAVQLNRSAHLIGEFPEDNIDTSNTNFNDPGWITAISMSSTDGGKTINIPKQDCVFYNGVYFAEASELYPASFPNNSSYWDEISGTFYLNLMYADEEGAWTPGVNIIQLRGHANGYEHALNITDNGNAYVDGKTYQNFSFHFDKFFDFVKYTIVYGELSKSEIAQVAEKISASQSEYTIQTIQREGDISINVSQVGTYTLVAVGYHINGSGQYEAKTTASVYFTVSTLDPYTGWTIVNPSVAYTDYILADLFGLPSNETYNVSLDASTETPGLYRLSGVTENNPYFYPEDCNGFSCLELMQVAENAWVIPYSDLGVAGYELEACTYAYFLLATGQAGVSELPAAYFITLNDGVFSTQPLPGEDYFNFVIFNGDNAIATPNLPFLADMNSAAAKPAKKAGTFKRIATSGKALKRAPVPAKFSAKFQKAETTKGHALNRDAARH